MNMDDYIYVQLGYSIIQFIGILGVFIILYFVGGFLYEKIKQNDYITSSRFLNPTEYIPEEEFTTIKQVFYLIMIIAFIVNILYLFFSWRDDTFNLLVLDVVLSLYLAINLDKNNSKRRLLILFTLIPFGSLSFLIFDEYSMVVFLDLLHILVYFYFIKVYYYKFVEYTETNSLGITIMLLFLIIFISFFVTMLVEGVSPLDSLVMVSNAFTSNGYAVLGKSGWGKIDSLLLVWSGYILSGVGTATLAVAIVMRHVNEKFDNIEELVKKNKKN